MTPAERHAPAFLRPLDPTRDGAALHAIFGDEESCRYMLEPAFKTIEETIERLKKWTRGFEDTSWAVVEGDALPSSALAGEGPGVGARAARDVLRLDSANAERPLTPNPSLAGGRGEFHRVVAKSIDSPALGRIALFTSGRDVWEVGCMIVPSARGRNLAARALGPAIDFVFETKAARRIFADIDPDNAASLRVFERLGFRREGVLRGNWKTHIGERDSVIMGLLRDDPRPWRT